VAAILAGAHYGLVNAIDPGPPSSVMDIWPHPGQHALLPRHWYEAIDWMAAGEILPNYLGRQFVNNYVAVKRHDRIASMAKTLSATYDWYLRNA